MILLIAPCAMAQQGPIIEWVQQRADSADSYQPELLVGASTVADSALAEPTVGSLGLLKATLPVVSSHEAISQIPVPSTDVTQSEVLADFAQLSSYALCPHGVEGNQCKICQGYSYPDDTVTGHSRLIGESWFCDGIGCDVQARPMIGPASAFRIGWWDVESDGSPVKVGEFQSLEASPFWDLDRIWTDSLRTLDFTFSGLDNEATDARAYYYGGPGFAANIDFQRYLRRLDHPPLSTFDLSSGTPGPNDRAVGEDLNVGEDYAIRVQQLDTQLKGRLSNNMNWRVDLWGMRKSGERQANAMAHCFDVNEAAGVQNLTCHVLSQRQVIDWTTVEVTPAVSTRVGNSTVEYSRTMRGFGQQDQVVTRTYTAFNFSPAFGAGGPDFNYGWVPETFTQIDRLKANVPLNATDSLYTHAYYGNTENKFRDTDRRFDGYDIRLTSRQFSDTTMTAYLKVDSQRNELPTTFLTSPPFGINSGNPSSFEPGSLRHPVNYKRARAGLKGSWRSPERTWLSVVSGYEYSDLSRDFADYVTFSGPFTQQDTQAHQFKFEPRMRVSSELETFIRYNAQFIRNPLLGVRSNDGKFNTNQPEQAHRVELGGTWTPRHNLMATAIFGIENTWSSSEFSDFDEDNYPIIVNVWWAPSNRWSFTGGYAFFSNWIDQDITIGYIDNPTETTRWNYFGYNNLLSLNSNFAWSQRTRLVGGIEFDWGDNFFNVPPSPAGANWSALSTFSDVLVETMRVNIGVDHDIGPSANAYFRYVHFDYEDKSAVIDSGTAEMFLAGFTILR